MRIEGQARKGDIKLDLIMQPTLTAKPRDLMIDEFFTDNRIYPSRQKRVQRFSYVDEGTPKKIDHQGGIGERMVSHLLSSNQPRLVRNEFLIER